MKLKIRRATKNKIVTLELETVDFSEKENAMLDQLGEPEINFEKSYGNNPIKIQKKIRTNFRVKLKFDANLEDDTERTAEYIENFIEEIKELLSEKMATLNEEYTDELIPREELFEIEY